MGRHWDKWGEILRLPEVTDLMSKPDWTFSEFFNLPGVQEILNRPGNQEYLYVKDSPHPEQDEQP